MGYKAGLALTQQDIMDQLPQERDLAGLDDRTVRLHSSMHEGLLARLLYRIGNIETPTVLFPGIGIYHMYKDDLEMMVVWTDLLELWNHRLSELVEKASQDKSPVDLMPFVETAAERYRTPPARKMLLEFLDEVALYLHSSLSLNIRRLEWIDVVALTDLFKSESLETYYGTFFDQRFIDYLVSNFDSIDRMHWRKFEGLTAEFFERSGFYVEIGPGRNDDSVDARVWPKEAEKHQPPTMLIQCKRQKEKIEKVVVKALYADILVEQAQSGLIVTTSRLSPGAATVRTA